MVQGADSGPALSVITAEPESPVTRLHRYVARRPDLRAAFHAEWARLERTALIGYREAWSETVMALFDINAGPGCVIAYLRFSAGHAGQVDAGVILETGRTARAICRECGARLATRFIESFGERAARLETEARAAPWLDGLRRTAEAGPAALEPTLENLPTVWRALEGPAFVDWVATGLRAGGGARAKLNAWFSLADPLARQLLEDAGEGAAAQYAAPLQSFAHALWDRPMKLGFLPLPDDPDAPPGRPVLAGRFVMLPRTLSEVSEEMRRKACFAAVAHAAAHRRFTPGRFDPGSLKPLQIVLTSLIEDARVEYLAIQRLPGLRRFWGPFHAIEPGTARTVPQLLERLSRALFDPDFDDPEPWVRKGRTMFQDRLDRIDDPAISREIGNLLGNDLGQMRIPFIARTYRAEPVYRDDHAGLWDREPPDGPQMEMQMSIDTARKEERENDDGERREDQAPDQDTGRVRPAGRPPEDGVPVATYAEWDRAAVRYRHDWTTILEVQPEPVPRNPMQDVLERHPALGHRIDALVRSVKFGRPKRQKKKAEGERLDMDAAIASVIAIRAGEDPDPRVYETFEREQRDISILLLLDASLSTGDRAGAKGERLIGIERDAALLLAGAMDRLGDPLSVAAFDSDGREKVRFRPLKAFGEDFGEAAARRIAAVEPGLSTRLGAAIRHCGALLAGERTHRRLLIVLTDGEPSDIDVRDPGYLTEDAKRAVQELRAEAIDVFAIGLKPEAGAAGQAVFGRRQFLPLRSVEQLPERLAMLYFRLMAR
ncbi:MAG: nitric oxide reductase activation protein NorD [Minwuia sp.]|uniref:nitric oxide reductase activation protein NorD n=1 Tax=Minwuia sp. TaxID=2493630 RepID=UPI003A86776F